MPDVVASYNVLYTSDRANKKRKRKSDGRLDVRSSGFAALYDAENGRELCCQKLSQTVQVQSAAACASTSGTQGLQTLITVVDSGTDRLLTRDVRAGGL